MSRTLHYEHNRFPLKAPFRIARGVKTAADVISVTIGEDGAMGRGEAVPYPRYGESVESALADVEAARDQIESGASRDDLLASLAAGSALNALDCALWDLEARLRGSSVAEMAGVEPPGRIASAITIGIDSPEGMARAAEAA